ncbi:MAG: class IV adenylate cyclase [Candidatus Sungbacteria bacterium]|nr:class IV adenylate cyclase [Candidatus Sungbacteria bacterium]
MKEIELKFRVANFKEIIPKLKKLGGKCVWRGIEESYFYDTPAKTLKRKHQMLRLRSWAEHSYSLALKLEPEHSHKRYKVRDEFQIIVDDINATREILKHLGFVEYIRYKKYREHWKLPGAFIELDTLKHLHFVEIEASKDRINQLAQILRLDWGQTTTQGYLSILRDLNRDA